MKKRSQVALIRKNDKVRIAPLHHQQRLDTISSLILNESQLKQIQSSLATKLESLNKSTSLPGDPLDIRNDRIIRQLQEMQRQAKSHNFQQLQRNITLALGKRILYLEIEKRKIQTEQKKIKKQQIEQSFFRYKKIRKFNYDQLMQQKLAENSYIVRPYNTGKGFIESQLYYAQLQDQIHIDRLHQCAYLDIVKQVNIIYMNNYSYYSSQSGKQFQNGIVINMALVLTMVLVVLGAMMMMGLSVEYVQYGLVADLGVILVVLSVLGVKTFVQKPNRNNQFEQTKEDVKEFFDKINRQNAKAGKNFTWSCPDNLMYLQVHFDQSA